MAVIWIPTQMRGFCAGRREVQVPGATLRQVFRNLEAECPGIWAEVCDDEGILPTINVAVDGDITGLGLLQPVEPDSEIQILPALAGGGSR